MEFVGGLRFRDGWVAVEGPTAASWAWGQPPAPPAQYALVKTLVECTMPDVHITCRLISGRLEECVSGGCALRSRVGKVHLDMYPAAINKGNSSYDGVGNNTEPQQQYKRCSHGAPRLISLGGVNRYLAIEEPLRKMMQVAALKMNCCFIADAYHFGV